MAAPVLVAAAAAAAATAAAATTTHLTLLLLCSGGRVLLGRKKRGFGVGKFNGFGGKIDAGETVLAAALREMAEESGVAVADAAAVGQLRFTFEDSPAILSVHVFRATSYTGAPTETEEMAPQWFPAGALPLAEMWKDDAFWLPHALAGERFVGEFLFRGTEEVLRHTLHLVEVLPVPPDAVLVQRRQADIAL